MATPFARVFAIALSVVSIASALPARIQCANWNGEFNVPGAVGTVEAMAVFDDGSGPALYVGGLLKSIGPAQQGPLSFLAKWNGASWSAVPFSPQGRVRALYVFDDGSGSALYAGGDFLGSAPYTRGIAKWNGASWSSVGGGVTDTGAMFVDDFIAWDDGTGAALYATGSFGRTDVRRCSLKHD